MHERRRDLRAVGERAGWDAAAREGVGRRDRRVIAAEAAEPLRPRGPRTTDGA